MDRRVGIVLVLLLSGCGCYIEPGDKAGSVMEYWDGCFVGKKSKTTAFDMPGHHSGITMSMVAD